MVKIRENGLNSLRVKITSKCIKTIWKNRVFIGLWISIWFREVQIIGLILISVLPLIWITTIMITSKQTLLISVEFKLVIASTKTIISITKMDIKKLQFKIK